MAVSDEVGLGEGTMSDFINQHMQNILQPFAEHVDQLHRSVDLLETDLQVTTDTANANKADIASHAALLAGLRSDLDGTTRRGHATQQSLEQTIKEKALLEADHQQSKARISAAEDKIRTLVWNVETLDRCTQDLRASLDKVTAAQSATEANLARDVYPTLAKHDAGISSVTHAHAATAQLLASTRAFAESIDREHKDFSRTCERQWRQDEEAFGHMNKTISDLSSALRENSNRIATHGDQVRTTNAKVRPLIVRIEQVEGLYQSVGEHRKEAIRDIAEMHERLSAQKEMIDKIVEKFGEDDPRKAKNIFDSVQKMSEQLTKHSQQLDRMDTTTRSTGKKVDEVDERSMQQGERHDDLVRRTVKVEDILGVDHHTFDGSVPSTPMASGMTPRGSTSGRHAGGMIPASPSRNTRATSHNIQFGMGMPLSVERNMKEWSISTGQKHAVRRIDATATAVAKTHAKLEQAITEHSNTEERVQTLEEELSLTNDMVAKLSASLDLKQEYWQGLSKGFRDVHRTVVVDNEMLPARSNLASTLPVLGKTARLGTTSPDNFASTM